ncbi:MAG: gluconeogenesis factor YvcK family protein, partial [Patescibacteria group bacterium]
GGGTGSYMVLRGLKKFPFDITAVVTIFDNGGSTGTLRDEFGILPPGDLRRCLIALSEGKRRAVLRDLFNFRFDKKGSSLHGHSFGNLFLLALSTIYGGDIKAIKKASELLNLKGRVLPVSLDSSHVHATLEDGTEIIGEANIDIPKHRGDLHIKKLTLEPSARIFEETNKAIREADLVVICPGDIYSSLVPNLLVGGMKEALRESKAKKIAICNSMTKWGETHNYAASDMIRELLKYSGLKKFDYVICNTKEISKNVQAKYAEEKKYPVRIDSRLEKCATKVIKADLLINSEVMRYDPETVAKILYEL